MRVLLSGMWRQYSDNAATFRQWWRFIDNDTVIYQHTRLRSRICYSETNSWIPYLPPNLRNYSNRSCASCVLQFESATDRIALILRLIKIWIHVLSWELQPSKKARRLIERFLKKSERVYCFLTCNTPAFRKLITLLLHTAPLAAL